MDFRRQQIAILFKRWKEKRNFIQIIIGARQVGKTTLVTQFLKKIDTPFHFASADGLGVYEDLWLRNQWETARIKLKTTAANELILVIDEIQKVSNWSEIVKAEWDKDTFDATNIKVILLGSSTLLLQKGMSESLMGRFEQFTLPHWSFSEMQTAFGFSPEEYVWFGGYPGAASLIPDSARWKNYIINSLIEPTITRDILLMERINKPALLRQLFELGCLSSGQMFSYNKMLGQLHGAGNTTTLSHYLGLLSNAGLLTGIEKYFQQKHKRKGSSPKFQVYNTALMTAQMDISFEEAKKQPKIWGRIVESAVGAHFLNQSKIKNFDIYYWRYGNDEIDFVLKYKEEIIGVEVKSGKNTRTRWGAFQKKFHPKKVIMVGERGIPWEDILKLNPVDLF